VSCGLPGLELKEMCRISNDDDEEQKEAFTDCTLAVGFRKSIGVSFHWAWSCIL
jgi:hypothetical protein